RPSIWLKHCILFPIGVFLLGLTLPMSQILFWDTERIRLLYFPQQAGRRQPRYYNVTSIILLRRSAAWISVIFYKTEFRFKNKLARLMNQFLRIFQHLSRRFVS